MPEHDNSGKQGRVTRELARIRANPVGRLALRIGIAIAGTLTIAAGIILLPLPGPGWLIVFAGLAIWSIEFRWARSLTVFVRRQVTTWTRWYAARSWPLRIALAAALAVAILAIAVAGYAISTA